MNKDREIGGLTENRAFPPAIENIPGVEGRLGSGKSLSRRDFLKLGATAALAAIASCTPAGPVIDLVRTDVPINPTSFPNTEIAPTPNPDVVVQIKSWRSLSEAETLGIPVARTVAGELIPLSTVFDVFKADENIKKLFADQSSISYSAMGIEVTPEGNFQPTKYPFFIATSDSEQKGYIAMVSAEGPVVTYSVLNRVIENEIVGLGITNDTFTGEEINPPVMIFSSGLTEEQIAQMSSESLSQLDFTFIPRGLNNVSLPGENIPGGSKVFALLVPEINEYNRNPGFTETVSQEFMGVPISTKLITDKALDPIITQIRINDHYENSNGQESKVAITEFTARTFYQVWLEKGGPDGKGPTENISFEKFMELWAKASKSGDQKDWEKVQIITGFNNPHDGDGYKLRQVTIWPMYQGTAPTGVRATNEFVVTFTKPNRLKNPNTIWEASGDKMDINLDGTSLLIDIGIETISVRTNMATALTELMAVIPSRMISPSGRFVNEELREIISTEVIPNAHKAAVQVFPQSDLEKQYNP